MSVLDPATAGVRLTDTNVGDVHTGPTEGRSQRQHAWLGRGRLGEINDLIR